MLASITWPWPDLLLSKSAITTPKAHISPPPAKSASMLIGGAGLFSPHANVDKTPIK